MHRIVPITLNVTPAEIPEGGDAFAHCLADEAKKAGWCPEVIYMPSRPMIKGLRLNMKGNTQPGKALFLERLEYEPNEEGMSWGRHTGVTDVTIAGPLVSFYPVCPEDLDEMTNEQVFFLNWSRVWTDEIGDFWNGTHDCKTMEEFIQHLKDTCIPVYERIGCHTKSMSKS